MKIKKSFGLLAAVAVVAAAGWSYQQSKQYDGMSELALANVEALAQYEGENAVGMYMHFHEDTQCYVCEYGGSGICSISMQCCKSWGNCPY